MQDLRHLRAPYAAKRSSPAGFRALACACRYAWAAPATLVGLAATAVFAATGARVRLLDGVVEVSGGAIARLPARRFVAITIGHVVLARDQASADACRVHERAHVRQYERFGPFFVPLYFAASAWAAACGRHGYLDNPFEREARRAERAGTCRD